MRTQKCRKIAVTVVLVLVLILGLEMNQVTGSTENNSQTLNEHEQNESTANAMYQELMDSFEKMRISSQRYPEYYAGAYINEEGNLVILYKDDEVGKIPSLNLFQEDETYIVETRKYSYNELEDIINQISFMLANVKQYTLDEQNALSKIQGYYIVQEENKVHVSIEDLNQATRELLTYEIDNNDTLVYEEAFIVFD